MEPGVGMEHGTMARGRSGDPGDPGGLPGACFDQVPVAQAVLDPAGRFVAVNRSWSELFGYPGAELVGRHLATVLPGDEAAVPVAEVRALASGDAEVVHRDVVGRAADGRRLSLTVDAALVRDPAGQPAAVALVAHDLTQVQEAGLRLAAQERMFLALSRRSADSAIVMDAELNTVYVSPSVTDHFGYAQAALLLASTRELVHPDDAGSVASCIDAVVERPEHTERFTARLKDAQGRWRWVEHTATNCLTDRDIGGLVVNLRDVTERVEAEAALKESEARYRAIVETAQEGILVTGPDGRTIFANEVLAGILGLSLRAVYAWAPRLITDEAVRESDGDGDGSRRSEVVYFRPDGEERILLVSSTPLDTEQGRPGTLQMVSDVTAERRSAAELRRKALHDPLTDLPNRYLLQDRLSVAAARCARVPGLEMAVLFLDLDRFKAVNDEHGHEVGDSLLQEVASRLLASTRPADTVARLGGDEFAIVCEVPGVEAARVVAERVHRSFVDPIEVGENTFCIGASIGLALSPPLDPTELLRRADIAMYQAKAAGGSVTVVFEQPPSGG